MRKGQSKSCTGNTAHPSSEKRASFLVFEKKPGCGCAKVRKCQEVEDERYWHCSCRHERSPVHAAEEYMEIHTIVVPVDCSAYAEKALTWVVALAELS
jgi:hypothetical protein